MRVNWPETNYKSWQFFWDSAATFDWDSTNLVTLDIFNETLFTRYQKNTDMFNWSPCMLGKQLPNVKVAEPLLVAD